ncbi:MAG: hypothetical protein S4CHLAM45_05910 [Chlamydiales bacterium]|nr:hypothetical protein [Chlamydiales bacterium]MCH9619868.1 hypothetical protein [Chlamydiales bacterium]MCH9622705.1 hypothetical protein [Chlamydiales bacterium]
MHLLKPGPHYSWKRVIFTLFLSFLPLTTLFFLQKKTDPSFITRIIQTGELPTEYLAEVLELSCDKPTLLSEFDLAWGREKLLATALVSEVSIKKKAPDLLSIDYTIRKPIAVIGNIQNTGIDKEGVLIPLLPIHFPKRLIQVILPPKKRVWGEQVAFDPNFLNPCFTHLDLSHPREIVAHTIHGDLLRLEKSTQQLPLYYKLRAEVLKGPSIVDLRLPDCAFIQEFCGSLYSNSLDVR